MRRRLARSNTSSQHSCAIAASMSPGGRSKARRRRSSTSSGAPSAAIASGARAQARRKELAPPSPSRWLSAWTSPISPSSRAASARTSNSASVGRASSCSSRPSSARKPGTSPASAGKAASRLCAKAWMVWMRRPPPGASSTFAKSVRAVASARGSSCASPSANSSFFSFASSSRTQ